jgi:hypothetical protein
MVLGHLVDISLDGFMLLGGEGIPVGRIFRLGLELPEDCEYGEYGAQAEFGAESLWAEPSLEPAKQWAGFHIIDIAPESAARISRLIDNL